LFKKYERILEKNSGSVFDKIGIKALSGLSFCSGDPSTIINIISMQGDQKLVSIFK